MIQAPQNIDIKHYQYVSDISSLDIIKNESVNIAICERDLNKDTDVFLNQLVNVHFNPINTILSITDFDELFDAHFKTFQPVSPSGYQFLKNDIKHLIMFFSEICNTSHVKVFFGMVDTDMCRQFHVDIHELRMLCTYQGQGTFWLTEDNINHKALDQYNAVEKIALRERDIKQLNTNDIAITKGALYPNSKIGGLVHKSPAIEELNQKRILLRIDNGSLFDSI